MLKEHEQLIRSTLESYMKFEPERERFYELLGFEGNYCEALHKFIDDTLKAIQTVVGDDGSDWMGWFIYETDCGKNPSTVKHPSKEIYVDSIDKLIEVMKL